MDIVRFAKCILFWIAVVAVTIAYCCLLPLLFIPRRQVLRVVQSYILVMLWLAKGVLLLKLECKGSSEALRRSDFLFAIKHQSLIETLIIQYLLQDPAIVLKKELLDIPVLGWVLRRLGHIGVDRGGSLATTRCLLEAARAAHREGRQVAIFPEGSRRKVGALPNYQSGVGLLYSALSTTCVPVAVNSGLLWARGSLAPTGGRLVIEFLPAIPPGLRRDEFEGELETVIEQATRRLMDEARASRVGSTD